MTRATPTFEFKPNGWPDGFSCCVSYHRAELATGEWGYSMGDPPVPEHCEFEGITLNGKDVSGWLSENLLLDEEELAEQAMDFVPSNLKSND